MRLILFILSISIFSCAPKGIERNSTKEQKVIDRAIKEHGGKLYNKAHYSFEFRGKQYSFKHEESRYEYTLDQTKNNQKVHYTLNNGGLTHSIDGKDVSLNDLDVTRYGNSLNSVIYFALLPYRLNDPAVNKFYRDPTTIKGQNYEVIEIRFEKEGGGVDHDDVYYYWINQKTNTVDYLAYSFHVNGGGVRFRAAYNSRVVDGIRFQDYENYKADKETNLKDLPQLYEQGSLKLLSKIELEHVERLK